MKRITRVVALVAFLGLVAAACARGDETGGGGTQGGEVKAGGTLRMAMNTDVCNGFDPQKAYCSINWEFTRVMLRTMLAMPGVEAEKGGTELVPDLAAEVPTTENGGISSDGNTWTFKIKPGLHYAPPLQDVEITAADFIRALEREADPEASSSGYNFYYSVIKGFDDFGGGKADSISGLSAPDEHTLQVTLTEPAGDLGFRFAMAATAPIPPNPDDPDARLGVAEGHTKDYGRFLISSGRYMFEGSENLDFSVAPDDQKPVSGYQPERSIVLVRNPTWVAERDSDEVRPAYVDRIEVEIGATVEDIANKVDAGETDIGFDSSYTSEQLQRYQNDPALEPRAHINEGAVTSYITMNLAEKPFDDVYVRRAFNWVVDKEAIRRVVGGAALGGIAGHILPNGLTLNKLADYDPYATPDSKGDVTKAMEEMKQSAYDKDGDGKCDESPECQGVFTVADQADPAPKRVAVIQDNLKQIGITLDVKYASFSSMYVKCEDPENHVALCPTVAWAQDYPDPITFMPLLFHAEAIYPACCNLSMLGATPDQLKDWGTSAESVPSVDADLDACEPLVGEARVDCYVEVEKKLMEEVVPWVPLRFANQIDIVSENVVNFTFDAFADQMSLDHVAVANAGA